MNTFLNNINTYIREPFEVAVLIVHHVGHAAKDRLRGAYSLGAGIDSHSLITKEAGNVCLHSPGKLKDGMPLPDTYFSYEQIMLGKDDYNGDITSLALTHQSNYVAPKKAIHAKGVNQQFIYDLIKSEGASVKKDAKAAFKKFKIEEGSNFHPNDFYRTLGALEEKGLLVIAGDKILLSQ